MAVQNHGEDEPDQYFIGRALRIVKVHSEAGSFPGTNGRVRFDPGALEIAVGMV